MAAVEKHISTKLVLRLAVGEEKGKKITKTVTISGIREGAPADALWEVAKAIGVLLEYPIAAVELHTVRAIEQYDERQEGKWRNTDGDALPADRPSALQSLDSDMPAHGTSLGFGDSSDRVSRAVLSSPNNVFSRSETVRHSLRAPPVD